MTLRSVLVLCALAGVGCGSQDHSSKTPTTTSADATRAPARHGDGRSKTDPRDRTDHPVTMAEAPRTGAATAESPIPGPPPVLTPMDQGNSTFELNVTTSIRRSVLGDNSLSMSAKNVKIITVGTKVTLRGLCKTDAEKTRIGVFAWQPTGVTEVDNQLEVGQ